MAECNRCKNEIIPNCLYAIDGELVCKKCLDYTGKQIRDFYENKKQLTFSDEVKVKKIKILDSLKGE